MLHPYRAREAAQLESASPPASVGFVELQRQASGDSFSQQ
jgi:hypothetical protein